MNVGYRIILTLRLLAEAQGDTSLASSAAIHVLSFLRGSAVEHWSVVKYGVYIDAFPVALSTRNYCLIARSSSRRETWTSGLVNSQGPWFVVRLCLLLAFVDILVIYLSDETIPQHVWCPYPRYRRHQEIRGRHSKRSPAGRAKMHLINYPVDGLESNADESCCVLFQGTR